MSASLPPPSATDAAPVPRERIARRRIDWRQGVQLGAAVVLAHVASRLLVLPEALWSVMSVLIVMRPDAGATLAAGWERLRGTMAGAACGLGGVWLRQRGLDAGEVAFGIAALLAFATGAVPGWRSAPIAALIVLASHALPNHSPMQVALLRVVQIALGVGAAFGVAFVASRLRPASRLHAGCARVLRGATQRWARRRPPAATALPSGGDTLRQGLERLHALARGADDAATLLQRWRKPRDGVATNAEHHRRLVALVGQACADASALDRALAGADLALWRRVAGAARGAMNAAADRLDSTPIDLAALHGLASLVDELHGCDAPAAMRAIGPAHLLVRDLQAIVAATDGNGAAANMVPGGDRLVGPDDTAIAR
jgi:uncharacterized membrane protein YccC